MGASILAAVIAALENPTVDAEIVTAGAALVQWFRSLNPSDQQKAEAQVDGLVALNMSQVSGADADLAAAVAEIASLRQQHQAAAQKVVDAFANRLREVVTNLPAPVLVKDPTP